MVEGMRKKMCYKCVLFDLLLLKRLLKKPAVFLKFALREESPPPALDLLVVLGPVAAAPFSEPPGSGTTSESDLGRSPWRPPCRPLMWYVCRRGETESREEEAEREEGEDLWSAAEAEVASSRSNLGNREDQGRGSGMENDNGAAVASILSSGRATVPGRSRKRAQRA